MKTVLLTLVAAALALPADAQSWSVTSPNGQVKLSVQLAERAAAPLDPAGLTLSYRVELGAEGSRVAVVNDSPLGLAFRGEPFVSGLRLASAQPVKLIEEAYEMPHGKRRQCHNRANELTLSFLNKSGWLHFADRAESYLKLPAAAKEFLKQVPVAWDDTRFIAGHPGQFVVLARRKGDTWYLAGVNGQNQPREARLQPGAWLPAGRHEMTLISDGQEARSFASVTEPIDSGSGFVAKMLPYGGFVAILKTGK